MYVYNLDMIKSRIRTWLMEHPEALTLAFGLVLYSADLDLMSGASATTGP